MPELLNTNSGTLYRQWAADNPKAVLLLVHGLGAHSARWDFLAEYFRDKNFSSYAIELKGFGETKTFPGHIDSFSTYYRDVMELHDLIKSRNPGKKIFLLSESMGGLISFNLMSSNPRLFSGLIMISPAFSNGMKFMAKDYFMAFASLPFNPKYLIKIPFTSEMCTKCKPVQDFMNKDPRELRVASSKLLFNILMAQLKAKTYFKKADFPILFLLAGKDYLVNENVNHAVFLKIASKDKTLIDYPNMLHALSIEQDREKVFDDIYYWIQARITSD